MKNLTIFILSFISAGLSGCKVTMGPRTNQDCSSSSTTCEGSPDEKPSALQGEWRSANSVVEGPMTYFKRLEFQGERLRLTQVCMRTDGRIVNSSINLRAQINSLRIVISNGGERREDAYGISCLASLTSGNWAYLVSQDGNKLELTNLQTSEISRYQKIY